MALSWNTLRALPRLYTYADADAWERDTKPIRGDKDGRKPLGRRNQKWRHIKREADNSIAIYVQGWLEQDYPLIRFCPNGEIHVTTKAYWNKAAENEVTACVLGTNVFTEQGRAWIRHADGFSPLPAMPKAQWVNDKYALTGEPPEPAIFIRTEQGQLKLINPPTLTRHVVSRKAAKQVRERYTDGINYVKALLKLRRDHLPTWEEIRAAFPDKLTEEDMKYYWQRRTKLPGVLDSYFTHDHAREIAALLASPEPGEQYKAYLWIQLGTTSEGAVKNIDKVLMMIHPDEWFVEREVPVGKKAHDRYAWAFPQQG